MAEAKRICLINAHPDPAPERFCFALTDAYQAAAEVAGHQVQRFNMAELEFGFLNTAEEFEAPPPDDIKRLQDAVTASDHVVMTYPLWYGTLPAKTKAGLEHLGRHAYLIGKSDSAHAWPQQHMKGKSARLVVTMGMPGFAYRLFFGAHSLKGLEAGLFRISGFKPVRHTIFGGVELSADHRARMLRTMTDLGRRGA